MSNIAFSSGNVTPFTTSPIAHSACQQSLAKTNNTHSESEPNTSDYLNSESLIVSPNPVTDVLKLRVNRNSSNKEYKLIILDMFGRTVITKIVNDPLADININTSNLNPGLFTIMVNDGQDKLITRFTKN